MFVLAWILVGAGILFDLYELVRRCVAIAERKGDISATPLFSLVLSLAGVGILGKVRLTLDSAILLGMALFFLHICMQALFPFLLRAPFNYFAGHKGSLFDPLSLSYPIKKEAPSDTSTHEA